MSKIKTKRVAPSLDMTPMVDLAFLLVTFFMLISKFAPEEAVVVDTPSSNSQINVPEINLITVSMAKDNKVYFNMDGKFNREKLIQKMSERYKVSFTPEQITRFSILSSFGVPMANLPQFLSMTEAQRKEYKQPGIPADSARNELADWLLMARLSNPKARLAIKGDGEAAYPVVKQVFNTLQDKRINRFNLITDLETTAAPAAKAAAH